MNPSAHILVVEDKQSFRFMLQSYLETADFKTTCVAGGMEALAALAASEVDMIISDMVMPGMDGMVLLQEVRSLFPAMPFFILTAHGTIDNAVATMKQGATDYLLKPIHRDELILLVSRHLENACLRYNHDQMAAELHGRFNFQNMIRMTLCFDFDPDQFSYDTVIICSFSGKHQVWNDDLQCSRHIRWKRSENRADNLL